MEQKVISRRFLGKVGSMTTPKQKAELKAYLKGKELFSNGRPIILDKVYPKQFLVRQELIFEN